MGVKSSQLYDILGENYSFQIAEEEIYLVVHFRATLRFVVLVEVTLMK